jgi:diguanylate cyclase (GGDEF)-like protein
MRSDPEDLLLQPFGPAETLDLESLMGDASEAVVLVDQNWTALYCNQTYANNVGLPREQVIGRTAFEYTPTDFKRSIFFEACQHCLIHKQAVSKIGYSTVLGRWLLVRVFPVRGGVLMLANDASESVVKGYQLAQRAVVDSLTGLNNKLGLEQRVLEDVSAMQPFGLVMMGLRKFRTVNETYGFLTGDLALLEVASRLQSTSLDGETVYRISGDEFAVLLPGLQDVRGRAQAFVRAVQAPINVAGQRIVLDASAGTIASPADGTDFEGLLKQVGLALGEAKRVAGSVVPFRVDLELAAKLRAILENELRHCLDGSQFSLVLQPKVSLISGEVVGAEALIRWQHPRRGVLAPAAFLGIARDIGAMRSIDTWVIRQSLMICRHLKAWGASFPISVNLSAEALADAELPQMLAQELLSADVPASMLEIEIPEGDLMADVRASVRTLTALHQMGIRLSIDDFGTGFSSFAYLAQFPVHDLKIDRSFVSDLAGPASEIPRKIVKGIVRLSHSLGLGVVAEGAETDAQLAALRKLKCDAVQGFAVSRPLGLPEFRDFCSARILHNTAPNPMSL